ncbi:MAG: hypothetical protein Q8O14_13950 [bacterium]|jgi:hypothetical protein|nr:hypothetical protein [bacterium]
MTRDPILVHQISKACLAGYRQGLEGTHVGVPPLIDAHVDDTYRLAFQDGLQEARTRMQEGKVHPDELQRVRNDHATRWKEGAECALDQVTRYLPRAEAAALAEYNARKRLLFVGTAFSDGYDAVMEAADSLAKPLQDAQRDFKEIHRIIQEGHDLLDTAGVPACPPDPEVEDRSLIALVRRLAGLPMVTATSEPVPAPAN